MKQDTSEKLSYYAEIINDKPVENNIYVESTL